MGIMQIYHMGYGKRRCMKKKVDSFMEKLEHLMEIGGTKKDIVSCSLFPVLLRFSVCWVFSHCRLTSCASR